MIIGSRGFRFGPFWRVLGVAVWFLLILPAALGQERQSGISDEQYGPMRERARQGVISLAPVAGISLESMAATGSSETVVSNPENEGLEIEGMITYESTYNGSSGVTRFTAERIMNYRAAGTHSGFLRLALWATKTAPAYGGTISFYNLGALDLNPISGGYSYTNVISGELPFTTPPAGTYYISLVLLEYSSGNYYYVDIRTFPNTWTIGGTAPVACSPTNSKFCAQSNRFAVSLWARDQRTGKTDNGHLMLTTGVYGMFGFPVIAGNTSDPQVFVKVLDGRPVNGKWWVFCATLTDVEFKVTVTDTQTGQTRTYHKLAGTTTSTFDTGAF